MKNVGHDVVTLGECLVALVAAQHGPLREVTVFERHVAGAEANTAIGLSRLGHSTAFIGCVGADAFGQTITNRMRGEAVDITKLRSVGSMTTGMLVRERRGIGASEVWYQRTHSAGSTLGPDDVDSAHSLIKGARWLHLSGVTPALSESCRAAAFEAVKLARGAGTKVSFAVNHRAKLWKGAEGYEVLHALACQSDLIFASAEEVCALGGNATIETAMAALSERTGADVVVTRGGGGAVALLRDGQEASHRGYPVVVVDTVGAGDAFSAGYLSATLRNLELAARLEVGNACGASTVAALGDLVGLPSWTEVERIRNAENDALR